MIATCACEALAQDVKRPIDSFDLPRGQEGRAGEGGVEGGVGRDERQPMEARARPGSGFGIRLRLTRAVSLVIHMPRLSNTKSDARASSTHSHTIAGLFL